MPPALEVLAPGGIVVGCMQFVYMRGIMRNKKNKLGSVRESLLERIEHNWLEIAAAALLALATIMSAWSAYNSATWHGRGTEHYDSADSARVQSSELLDELIQDKIIDVIVFTDYMNAVGEGNTELAEAYHTRMNPRLKVALDTWEKMNPMTNPEAPRTPFQIAEYKDEYLEASKKAADKASGYSTRATAAMRNSNNFILLTVLFAGVLFFAGISTKFQSKQMKVVMLAFGMVVFLASVVIFALQPNL